MQDFPQETLCQHPWKEMQPSPLERKHKWPKLHYTGALKNSSERVANDCPVDRFANVAFSSRK